MLVEQYALILDHCKDYENFHLTSCKLANEIISKKDYGELSKLEAAIRWVSANKYSSGAFSYILDYISLYNAFIIGPGNRKAESELREKIVENFNIMFPEFAFIKKEYSINKKNRIDILAKDIKTQRYVIFELKTGKGNPNKQLERYSEYFDNPILIGVTEIALSGCERKNGIQYYTFDELLSKKIP